MIRSVRLLSSVASIKVMATCIILQTQKLAPPFHPNMLAIFLGRTGLGFGMRNAFRTGYESPKENKDMRDNIQDDPLAREVQPSSSPGSSATLAAIGGWWKAYWKLALGMLLVTLLVLFVVQNANAIRVKFLVWETDISQALVIFLTLLSGVLIGVMVNRWQRWRLSHSSRNSQ